MPTEISILWFVITLGIMLIIILIFMMNTRRHLALVKEALEESRRVISNERLLVTERQIQLIFDLIERRLASLLHAPHLPAMDALLQKLALQTATAEEARELYVMLIERRADLVIEGISRPDLDFPELFVLWSLEVRMTQAGLDIPYPPLTTRLRPPPEVPRPGEPTES